MKRSGPPVRKTPLERGSGLKRSRKPIPQFSEKRADRRDDRDELRRRVLRDHPFCQAKIQRICMGESTEVNELKRRSQWAEGYLIDYNCEGLCSACHQWITDHPGRDGWAMRHGHQVSGAAGDEDYVIAIAARFLGEGCSRFCSEDHRDEPDDPDEVRPGDLQGLPRGDGAPG